MFRVSLPARRNRRRGFASSLAIAIAFAGGSAVGVVATAVPAHAQDKPEYSKDFVKAYEAANELVTGNEGAEAEAVRPLLPGVIALAQNDDERFVTGQLMLNAGLALDDTKLQREGIIMQLDSGKLPAERMPLFSYYAGSLSWGLDDYQNARKYLTQAFDLGQDDDGLALLILESHMRLEQPVQALAELKRMLAARPGAISEDTLRRAVQIAYEGGMSDVVDDWSVELVRHYPRTEIWNIAASVLLDSYEFTSQESLDLYRLMARKDALVSAREYIDYISAADARSMSNEVLPIVQQGLSRGLLESGDVFVDEALEVASDRAPNDRADAQMLADEARASSTGLSARAAGDNFLSFGAAAEAEEMYKLALEKGVEDSGRVIMRLGMMQADQGKFDEARQTLGQLTGNRAIIASMWLAHIDAEANAVAPPPPTAAAPAQ